MNPILAFILTLITVALGVPILGSIVYYLAARSRRPMVTTNHARDARHDNH
jgi:hypothetical protein